ncbi:MAG: hypothetical protein AAGA48_39880, partial [Myxococcota bacterium]
AMELALAGEITQTTVLDPDRIAVGGYSIGGPMSLFMAAEQPEVAAVVLWAPVGSPFWRGLRPQRLYPLVTQDILMLLGELDRGAPPEGGFPQKLKDRLTGAGDIETVVIEGGTHTQFQQPIAKGEPEAGLSRFDQQAFSITETKRFLDEQLGPLATE